MNNYLFLVFFTLSLTLAQAQSTNDAPATNIVVTTITPPTPPPVIIHRVMVPSIISTTLAPQLLAQIDAQAPAGKVVSRMLIVRAADGSFTATITYADAPSGN